MSSLRALRSATVAGLDNLTGQAGATVMAGQAVQLVGVITATVFGLLAFRAARTN